jgi:large subunit ribosomal protein L13
MAKDPTQVIRHAVRGMLPSNRLGRRLLKKLKVYAGTAHPHEAQQPKDLVLPS